MERTSRPIRGDDPSVLASLLAAGWVEGRRVDTSAWVDMLEAAGFELNEVALRVWAELGGLRILSSKSRVPGSSLHIDPVDACIDAVDEASTLSRKFRENYSPLGMWSVQFRSYIGASERVIAVGPRVMWELGSGIADTLDYVINGDGGDSRAQQADWLA